MLLPPHPNWTLLPDPDSEENTLFQRTTIPPLNSHLSPFYAVFQVTWHPQNQYQIYKVNDPVCFIYRPSAENHMRDLALERSLRSAHVAQTVNHGADQRDLDFQMKPGLCPNGSALGLGYQYIRDNGWVESIYIKSTQDGQHWDENLDAARTTHAAHHPDETPEPGDLQEARNASHGTRHDNGTTNGAIGVEQSQTSRENATQTSMYGQQRQQRPYEAQSQQQQYQAQPQQQTEGPDSNFNTIPQSGQYGLGQAIIPGQDGFGTSPSAQQAQQNFAEGPFSSSMPTQSIDTVNNASRSGSRPIAAATGTRGRGLDGSSRRSA